MAELARSMFRVNGRITGFSGVCAACIPVRAGTLSSIIADFWGAAPSLRSLPRRSRRLLLSGILTRADGAGLSYSSGTSGERGGGGPAALPIRDRTQYGLRPSLQRAVISSARNPMAMNCAAQQDGHYGVIKQVALMEVDHIQRRNSRDTIHQAESTVMPKPPSEKQSKPRVPRKCCGRCQ